MADEVTSAVGAGLAVKNDFGDALCVRRYRGRQQDAAGAPPAKEDVGRSRGKIDAGRHSRRYVRLVRRRVLAAVDGCLRLAELLVGRCVGDAALEAIHVVIGGATAGAGVSKGFAAAEE